jgi:hypothetical protein
MPDRPFESHATVKPMPGTCLACVYGEGHGPHVGCRVAEGLTLEREMWARAQAGVSEIHREFNREYAR